MAKNPNPKLVNHHCLYLATSGGGKSQGVKNNKLLQQKPTAKRRILIYDPNEDHPAEKYSKLSAFILAVLAYERANKGYRVSYVGGMGEKDHEAFFAAIWNVLDGNKQTIVIDEEVAGSSTSSAKAAPKFARCMNQGRKFGLIWAGTTQRSQEIPKTCYEQAGTIYIGQQQGNNLKRLQADIIGRAGDIASLKPLEFYKVQGVSIEKVKMRYIE